MRYEIAARESMRGLALGDAFGETWLSKPAAFLETARTGLAAVPTEWLESCEPLPAWVTAG